MGTNTPKQHRLALTSLGAFKRLRRLELPGNAAQELPVELGWFLQSPLQIINFGGKYGEI